MQRSFLFMGCGLTCGKGWGGRVKKRDSGLGGELVWAINRIFRVDDGDGACYRGGRVGRCDDRGSSRWWKVWSALWALGDTIRLGSGWGSKVLEW